MLVLVVVTKGENNKGREAIEISGRPSQPKRATQVMQTRQSQASVEKNLIPESADVSNPVY